MSEMCSSRCLSEACLLLGSHCACLSAVTWVPGAGTQWLIWKYESDSTLGDATSGALGPFPECLAPYFLRGSG